jgi:hypothetical protein
MSWVDEFDCRRVVVDQLSVSSPVDQLSGSISCQSTSCQSIGYHRTKPGDGKGAKLGEGKGAKLGQEKGAKLGEGEKAKLGEGCPKVRLSQDRLPIFPLA